MQLAVLSLHTHVESATALCDSLFLAKTVILNMCWSVTPEGHRVHTCVYEWTWGTSGTSLARHCCLIPTTVVSLLPCVHMYVGLVAVNPL